MAHAYTSGGTYSTTWVNWTNATTDTATTTGNVWSVWNSTSTNTSITTNDTSTIWYTWTNGIASGVTTSGNFHRVTAPQLTPEQIAERQKQDRISLKKYQEQERKRRIAHARKQRAIRKAAADMLKEMLTPAQWREWQRYRALRHVGKRGIYEINPGYGGELYTLDHNGKATGKFCVHASREYPVEDRVAAMLLALQTDEDAVMQRANRNSFATNEERRLEARRIRMKDADYALN